MSQCASLFCSTQKVARTCDLGCTPCPAEPREELKTENHRAVAWVSHLGGYVPKCFIAAHPVQASLSAQACRFHEIMHITCGQGALAHSVVASHARLQIHLTNGTTRTSPHKVVHEQVTQDYETKRVPQIAARKTDYKGTAIADRNGRTEGCRRHGRDHNLEKMLLIDWQQVLKQ